MNESSWTPAHIAYAYTAPLEEIRKTLDRNRDRISTARKAADDSERRNDEIEAIYVDRLRHR